MEPYAVHYQNILIEIKEKTIHIANGEALKTFLSRGNGAARELSGFILTQHAEKYAQPLQIRQDSLSIEILGHVWAGRFAGWIRKRINRPGLIIRLTDKIIKSTDVIDCGGATVDTNRFIWDLCAPLYALARFLRQRRKRGNEG